MSFMEYVDRRFFVNGEHALHHEVVDAGNQMQVQNRDLVHTNEILRAELEHTQNEVVRLQGELEDTKDEVVVRNFRIRQLRSRAGMTGAIIASTAMITLLIWAGWKFFTSDWFGSTFNRGVETWGNLGSALLVLIVVVVAAALVATAVIFSMKYFRNRPSKEERKQERARKGLADQNSQ